MALAGFEEGKEAAMKAYHNSESGIDGYDYGDDWIRIHFKGGTVYEYRAPRVAHRHLTAMKKLADAQDGLNTYISKHRREVFSNGVRC